jgi:cytochrome c
MVRLFLAAACLSLAACAADGPMATAGAAAVQPPTRAEVGHRLADRLCSRCHQVGASGDSPNAASPPFTVLASRYSEVTLGRKLDDIATGHYDMPPTHVTNDEIDSLVAYLASLRGD